MQVLPLCMEIELKSTRSLRLVLVRRVNVRHIKPFYALTARHASTLSAGAILNWSNMNNTPTSTAVPLLYVFQLYDTRIRYSYDVQQAVEKQQSVQQLAYEYIARVYMHDSTRNQDILQFLLLYHVYAVFGSTVYYEQHLGHLSSRSTACFSQAWRAWSRRKRSPYPLWY